MSEWFSDDLDADSWESLLYDRFDAASDSQELEAIRLEMEREDEAELEAQYEMLSELKNPIGSEGRKLKNNNRQFDNVNDENKVSIKKWFYDNSGYFAYLLINGTRESVNAVVRELAKEKIRPLMVGQSYKPASNGVQYEHYARIIEVGRKYGEYQKPDRDKVERIVNRLIIQKKGIDGVRKQADDPNLQTIASLKAGIKDKKHEIEGLLKQNKQLNTRLKKNEEVILKHRFQANQQRQINEFLKNKLDIFEKTNKKLTVEKRELFSEKSEYEQLSEQYEIDVNEIKEKYREAEKQINEIEKTFQELEEIYVKENNEKDQKIIELTNTLDTEVFNHNKTTSSYEEKLATSTETSFNKSKEEQEFKEILSILLPNISMNASSYSCILHEFENRQDTLRKLKKIDCGKAKDLNSNKIHTTDTWRDIHVNTGKGMDGRLYYRSSKNEPNVILAFKKEQEMTIKQLKKYEKAVK
jgi:hypothetical protein